MTNIPRIEKLLPPIGFSHEYEITLSCEDVRALIAAVKALVDLRYAPPSQETDASRSAAIALAAFSFEAEA